MITPTLTIPARRELGDKRAKLSLRKASHASTEESRAQEQSPPR